MSQEVVTTLTLVESGEKEDAANEAITDLAFQPAAPLSASPPAYEAGATYAKNALVTEGTQIYRSQKAANKGNKPSEDTDFANWAPIGTSLVVLQNPAFGFPTATMTQQAHNNKPPARSDAKAAPLETIGTGAETPV